MSILQDNKAMEGYTPGERSQLETVAQAVDEYRDNVRSMRGNGISLSDYVRTYRIDNNVENPDGMPHDLASALDKMQQELGPVM